MCIIDIYSLALNLCSYLELEEQKQLVVSVKKFKISIYPINSIGSPITDMSARPTLECRFDEGANTFVLSWIYLINLKRGIGSGVVRMILDFCRANGIMIFQIRAIHKDNNGMLALGKKFGFKMISEDKDEFFYLSLEVV